MSVKRKIVYLTMNQMRIGMKVTVHEKVGGKSWDGRVIRVVTGTRGKIIDGRPVHVRDNNEVTIAGHKRPDQLVLTCFNIDQYQIAMRY